MDIFTRLVSESDPLLGGFRVKLICERCGEHGHTSRTKWYNHQSNPNLISIENLVDSLISNNE